VSGLVGGVAGFLVDLFAAPSGTELRQRTLRSADLLMTVLFLGPLTSLALFLIPLLVGLLVIYGIFKLLT
jgi:hypothetical protein